MQILNIPPKFNVDNATYEFQGAVCFEPPRHQTGVGHYTAVCNRGGNFVLFNDSNVSQRQDDVTRWLEKCVMLVYASS